MNRLETSASVRIHATASLGLALLLAPAARQDAEVALARADRSHYAAIDTALEGHDLLPLGATWRYFPGSGEPSTALEWTALDFDDSRWREGPSPFAFGLEFAGTVVEEIGAGATCVYLRRVLDVPNPSVYARILLELPVDDGFILYLNGVEERRRSAGSADERRPFDAGATSRRETSTRPMPVVDLTRALVSGPNVLAVQAFVHPADAATFAIEPRVRVVHRVTAEGEHGRSEAVGARLSEAEDAAGMAYLEGRVLQRLGELERAIGAFVTASELTPGEQAPLQRLVECHAALGQTAALEQWLRERIAAGERSAALLDTWAAFFLDGRERSPLDLVATFPDVTAPPDSVLFADAAWLGAELAAGRPVRIDCGALEDHVLGDARWGRDRFFAPASQARRVANAPDRGALDGTGMGPGIGASVRVATRSLDDVRPTYRIPLPAGAYELRAHLSSAGGEDGLAADGLEVDLLVELDSTFDLTLDGARAVRGFDPSAAEAGPSSVEERLPIYVADGLLELDLLPADELDPWIAGLELVPLEDEAFRASVGAWIESSGTASALARVQLARFLRDRGDAAAALALFEEAEAAADFQEADRAALAALRVERLPQLTSFASVDELLAAARGRGASVPQDLRDAAAGDGDFTRYLHARLEQKAGRFDEAIAEFEALVVKGTLAPEPYLRAAQCLAGLDLAPEAERILSDGIAAGIATPPALLSFWSALRVGPLAEDPWVVLADLRRFDPPAELVVAATSEEAPVRWSYTAIEPPTTTWSRLSYDVGSWDTGLGVVGAGLLPGAIARSLWNTESLFARRTFELAHFSLLYPHLRLRANDALDVYLNGTRVLNVGIPVDRYRAFPLRPSAVVPLPNARDSSALIAGENGLGMYANNAKNAAGVDVGIVQPLDLLFWIADRLEQDGALRINCGGDTFVAPDGAVWSEDRFYGWGQISFVDPALPIPDIAGTDNDTLYHTNRWFFEDVSTTWYQVPLPNGAYSVTLHFAEIEPDFRAPGARVFDVRAEGKLLLKDHDVAAAVGYEAADVHTFAVEVADGYLDLHVNGAVEWSFLSGLEIVRP